MMCGLYLLLLILFFHVCYSDIRYRKIRNTTTLLISCLSLAIGCLTPGGIFIIPALLVFTAGFLLSVIGVLGAGDVKLLAGLSLSLGSDDVILLLLLTALAGLPVALATVIGRYVKSSGQRGVPYGVAIVSGYTATVVLTRSAL
ncbi:A24 family peptidase [Pantoea sp. MBD-2R]|uniref:prepilin peptidase n=1 Tax=unclassified Pantoea TaxID=2630326 RepID=UPI0011BD4E95|nr:A24 family peptidase [Pantoea sp. CCBC3-3-1]